MRKRARTILNTPVGESRYIMRLKKQTIITSLLMGLFAITTFSGINLARNKNNNAQQAIASEGSYYDSITDSMTGTTLLSELNKIIDTTDVSVSYDWDRYEAADEDPNNKNNVIMIYARNSVSKTAHVDKGIGWNREHTFPQSKMSSNKAEKDNHIIFASDNKVNGARSNIKMGVVTGGEVVNDYFGNATTCRKTSSLFDPNNVARGIVARSTMYAAAMYNYDPADNFESIATMLRWHLNYPVTSSDLTRNEVVYENQHNRNPFVDHPEYACRIWGSTNSTTQSICSAASTGITSISKTSADLIVGNSTTISAVSSNSGTISWSSSNTSVATVSSETAASGSNITIAAVGAGTATITASITISGTTYSKSCEVSVAASKTVSSISVSGQTASFTVGDTFSFGGTVTASYNDGTTANVTASSNFDGYDMSTSGNQTVTVSYTYGGVTKTTSYGIVVRSGGSGGDGSYTIVPSSFSGTGYSGTFVDEEYAEVFGKTDCGNQNDTVQFKRSSGLLYNKTALTNISSIVLTTSSGGSNYITVYGGTTSKPSTTTISSSKSGSTYTYDFSSYSYPYFKLTSSSSNASNFSSIVINYGSGGSSDPTLTSITVDTSPETVYSVGEYFDPTGLIIEANYSDNTSLDVFYSKEPESFSFDPTTSTPLTTSHTKVTIGYGGETCELPITVSAVAPTSITATVKNGKTFYVGETITKSDIAVTTNQGLDVTNSITFNDYQFTYKDASSGGALTDREFEIKYGDLPSTSLVAKVQRKARFTPSPAVSDLLNQDVTEVTGTSYTAFSGKTATSSAVYAGQCAGGNSSIQLRSTSDKSNNFSGVITTSSGGNVSKIVVVWQAQTQSGRTLNVYGKNAAYSSANDLYVSSTQGTLLGTIVCGTSTELTVQGTYPYIGFRSADSAMYLTSVTITYGVGDTAVNLSNYIMYEDTPDQCKTKFGVAQGYFEGLSSSERSSFMTSNDYVIATARERLQAWAKYHGKQIVYQDEDYIIKDSRIINSIMNSENSGVIAIVTIIGLIGVTSLAGFFIIKKRKEH